MDRINWNYHWYRRFVNTIFDLVRVAQAEGNVAKKKNDLLKSLEILK
jgi:hypothetical protein